MKKRRTGRASNNDKLIIVFIILIIIAFVLFLIFKGLNNKDPNNITSNKTNDTSGSTLDTITNTIDNKNNLESDINVDYNIKGDENIVKITDTSKFSSKGVSLVTTPTETVPSLNVDFKHYTTDTLKVGVSVDQALTFFNNSVMFGDSITLGLGNYLKKSGTGKLGDLTVLGTGSYGVGNALMDISNTSIHPSYKGEQLQIWNYVKVLGTKKVFLMFGMNDVKRFGVLDSISNYENLIEKIREENPGIDIYIVSCTYRTKAAETNRFDKTIFTWFNTTLREKASTWKVGYIDIASYLLSDEGHLKDSYASDGEYHLNETAYKLVINIMRSYASYNI